MSQAFPVGLQVRQGAVPLCGVRIAACLRGPAAEVTVTQRYVNREAVPVEAVYVFPLEEGAAVCGFAARVGDRLIEGRVEERDAAFAAYDDAMADGDGAFLLDQERPNVFTASVGNLRPGEQVDIELRYVALAHTEGATVRFMIPTTVSPRYVPSSAPEIGQPDGERVNPEHRFSVPYGLTLSVDVEAGSAIVGVESPSHPIRTRLRERGATVELAVADAALDRDFVLLVEQATAVAAQALVARDDDGTRVCMVTFAPSPADGPAAGHEVLFLLDCSGSMGGDSIVQARRALELCVRALAAEDVFNVTRFGSSFESLWPSARPLDEASLGEAVRWVRSTDADLGGTEILEPLRALLGAPADPVRSRQVLLLTDGQVSNEADVIALAAAHAHEARVFTFGIGAGASEHLVRGVARAARGAATFIAPGERIEGPVLRAFNRVRAPGYRDVKVDWGGLVVEQAPAVVPPVFAGDFVTVFARLTGGDARSVALSAGGERWSVDLDLERAHVGGPLPRLWARHAIADLESGTSRGSSQRRAEVVAHQRERVIAIAKRYGLMSGETSFLAVEVRDAAERTTAPAELRRIPVALTSGWGGISSATGSWGGARTLGAPAPKRAARPVAVPAPAPPPAPFGPPTRSIAADASPGLSARGGHVPSLSRAEAPPQLVARSAVPAVAKRARVSSFDDADEARERTDEADFGWNAGGVDPWPAAEAGGLADRRVAYDSGADRLYLLLATQLADGRFAPSAVLRDWIGPRVAAFEAAVAAFGADLVGTSVALALLERDEAARHLEWRPALIKARRWLDAQSQGFDARTVLG